MVVYRYKVAPTTSVEANYQPETGFCSLKKGFFLKQCINLFGNGVVVMINKYNTLWHLILPTDKAKYFK